MGSEDFVGIRFEDAEGFLDATEDGAIGVGAGFGSTGIDPLMEVGSEFHEAGAFIGASRDAIAGEGMVHFEDTDLVVLGEVDAVVEGRAEGGEATGFGPRNPGAPSQEGGDSEDGGGEQCQAAW